MTPPVQFAALLDQVHVTATGTMTRMSVELPLHEAEIMLTNLMAAIERARAWRPAKGLADLLG